MMQETCEKCGQLGFLENRCMRCQKKICAGCLRKPHECCERIVAQKRPSVLQAFAISATDYDCWVTKDF
jgi:hypothetical protein